MSVISKRIIEKVKDYLELEGLSFDPFRGEIMDHIISDIESRVIRGVEEEEAMNQVLTEIPNDHLYSLEAETRQIISRQSKFNTVMGYISLALFLLASVFKLLHLPGASMFLVSGIALTSISFVYNVLAGAFIHKNKKGINLLLITTGAIVFFLISWLFKILSLSNGSVLFSVSIILLLILFPLLTLYFINRHSGNNILLYLHASSSKRIERFIIGLMIIGFFLWLASRYFEFEPFISVVIVILGVCISGLHHFALSWDFDSSFNKPNWVGVILITVSFFSFILPALGPLISLDLRMVLISLFFAISGGLVSNHTKLSIVRWVVPVVALFWIIWSLLHFLAPLHPLQADMFHPIIIILSMIGVWFSRRDAFAFSYLLIHMGNLIINWP